MLELSWNTFSKGVSSLTGIRCWCRKIPIVRQPNGLPLPPTALFSEICRRTWRAVDAAVSGTVRHADLLSSYTLNSPATGKLCASSHAGAPLLRHASAISAGRWWRSSLARRTAPSGCRTAA